MLQRIASSAIAAPRRILAAAALVMVACGIFGIPVAGKLSAGGLGDPTSESARASQILIDHFDQGDMDLLVSVTADGESRRPVPSPPRSSRACPPRPTSARSPRHGPRHRRQRRPWSVATARRG